MIKHCLIVIVVFISLYACNTSTYQNNVNDNYSKLNLIDTAKWFLGTWQNKTTEGLYTEQWNKKNDSVYCGISTVVVSNNDTVFYESILLQQKNDSLYYIVSVKNQNNELPVSFKLIKCNSNQLIFENSTHDFPSKITYLKITQDSMVASIFGLINGKEKTEKFPMKKIK